jgi:adenylate cyclase
MTAPRRIAVILAGNVVGFSRAVAANEEATLARFKARAELIDPAVAENRGRLFKTTGDGFLVEFASAVIPHAADLMDGLRKAGVPE